MRFVLMLCIAACLAACRSDPADEYLPVNADLGPFSEGYPPIAVAGFERLGKVTLKADRFLLVQPAGEGGVSRLARRTDPATYNQPSRFLEIHPEARLAEYGKLRHLNIHNPQFMEWWVLEGAHVEDLRLSLDYGCRPNISPSTRVCPFDYEAPSVSAEGLRSLTKIKGLKKLFVTVSHPPAPAHYDALNAVLDQAAEIEHLRMTGLDNCQLRWPRSIRMMMWPGADQVKTPPRTDHFKWGKRHSGSHEIDWKVHKDSGKDISLRYYDNPDLIMAVDANENTSGTGWLRHPAYVQARGKGVSEMLRLNCPPGSPALTHFGEGP